jgi:transcriptional antiterminator RfaH
MCYAVYTKPKKEDSVAFLLQNRGLEVLNPKIKSRKFKRNKLTDVVEPLFPCYIFANFDKYKYVHLITYTRGVRYIVGKKSSVAVQGRT